MRFIYLPQEIIQKIIIYVPDDDLKTLERVSCRLRHLSNDPSLWRARCRRFRYWEDNWGSSNDDGRPPCDLKKRFYRRISIEKQVIRLLDKIVVSPSKRIEYTEEIARHGYDVKDCLLEQLETPETASDWLARRFHASSTLAYIHRQRAIQHWDKLLQETITLEVAISCFDLFVVDDFAIDSERISDMLSAMSADILRTHRDFLELTQRNRATTIIHYMQSLGFLGCPRENYHDLVNCFTGMSMRTTKTTLPIASCSIFCSLAQRLGVNAYPCAYPCHVFVLVYEGKSSHFYLNPHEGADVISQPELELRLQEMGFTIGPSLINKFLRPASTSDLILRNARNILRNTPYARRRNQTDRIPGPDFNIDAAEYAALFATALLSITWPIRILEPLCRCLQESFPTDVGLIESYIIHRAGLESRHGRLLKTVCVALRNEDGMARKVKRRSSFENRGVLFFIGTVFQHRRYGYQAAITGWTINMTHEGVDFEESELQEGLKQPFYRVIVEDLSVRYVAQENILEQRPTSPGRLAHVLAGKYFKRFNSSEGRFVSNMREEYPED